MRLYDLMRTVLNSTAEDWESIPPPTGPQYVGEVFSPSEGQHWLEVREHFAYYVLRSDVSIALAVGMPGFHGKEQLTFDWAVWPDRSVTGEFVDVLYNGQVVHREQLLSVDGGRARLPIPTAALADTGQTFPQIFAETVTEDQVTLARLVDALTGHTEFDRYFNESRMVVVPDENEESD
jgi:hypothetical protein